MYRLAIVIAAVLGVATVAILLMLKKPNQSNGGPVYQGPGETNLDLESPDNTLFLNLKDGRVVIQLRPDLAPLHVARIKELVRQGFYDGLVFHRVIDGFMAQTGDPMGTGAGGSGVNLGAEFSEEKFVRGVVGMARSQDDNSADSQFYIMLGDGHWLDNKYTIWGVVKDGMEFVDNIKKGGKQTNGTIDGLPDKIVSMQIASDVADGQDKSSDEPQKSSNEPQAPAQ